MASTKKAAKKKAMSRKPAKKLAAKKPVKKPAAKKSAAKKPAAKKSAAPVWKEFPPVLQQLVDWVNGGRAGDMDFEMYESFNEQYKPSDWTRNPVADTEFFTFGMDGTGGQVAIWRREPEASFESLPVVFLGSEGELKPLATSLPGFLQLLASGLGPIEISFGQDPAPNEEMQAWVRGAFPAVEFAEPRVILDEAATALADFEQYVRSLVKG
jgi:hypothetical protein